MRLTFITLLLALGISCQKEPPKKTPSFEIIQMTTNSTSSLRGLAVVDEQIAWASGSQGTFLRCIDGENWLADSIPGAGNYDFRDIEAFSGEKALVMAAGYPAKIYKTTNGGQSWKETYSNETEGIFFDAMDFWDEQNGIAFSDAVNGHLVIITTTDGGNSWQEISYDDLPPSPAQGEGGFAASGTCLTTLGDSLVWIGLGSPDSRVFHSKDRGHTWSVVNTPMKQDSPSAGIFSLAFQNESFGIAVGGDYQKPMDSTANMAVSRNGGQRWELKKIDRPSGYRSAICNIPESEIWVAAGRGGTDFSLDNGNTWQLMDTVGFYTVQFASGKVGYMSGSGGRISKVKISYE